jgi:hypothetical protein
MKTLSLITLILLTGCSTTVPVTVKFPEAPASISKPCGDLKKIENENVSIVDLHKIVVENYTTHYECSTKVDGWNEWYVEQKKNFESLK